MTKVLEAKNVHIVGGGGIGISALAKFLHYKGAKVTASDLADSVTLQSLAQAGITVFIGEDANFVPKETDLLIYTSAAPETNKERLRATAMGISQLRYFAALGEISQGMHTVAVSGTNGKSTTTAMLGLIVEAAKLDPTVIVGSKVPGFKDGNLLYGHSDLLVAEVCEHNAHMLSFYPQIIALTNIEADHLDFYRDIQHIRDTFQEYIHHLSPAGMLILNADDYVSRFELKPTSHFITYGINSEADYMAIDINTVPGEQTFTLRDAKHDVLLGKIHLRVPGRFNVYNALCAAVTALHMGIDFDVIKRTLEAFNGIWRRFERLRNDDGLTIISDFGHHPTAVAGTLEAAKSFYPNARIMLAFEPHHHDRTKKLFNEFVASMDFADVVIVNEIFSVTGREHGGDSEVSSKDLVNAIHLRDQERGVQRVVEYAATYQDVKMLINKNLQPMDVVLLMGAGNLYKIAPDIG